MAVLREFWHRLRGMLRRDRPIPISSASCAFISSWPRRSSARRATRRSRAARMARVRLGRRATGPGGAARPARAAVARRPADRCADIGLRGLARRPGLAATAAPDARDRHRVDGGGRHVDERAALSAAAGARPGAARRRGAARRAHRGVPARAVVSRVPRLPGSQRGLRRPGRLRGGGGAVVDRRRSGRADPDRVRERQLLRRACSWMPSSAARSSPTRASGPAMRPSSC